MSAKNHLWCIQSLLDDRGLQGLTFIEIHAVVSVIEVRDRLNWVIWRDDWKEWRPLSQSKELLQAFPERKLAQAPPTLSESVDQFETAIKKVFVENEFSEGREGTLTDIDMDMAKELEVERSQGEFVIRLYPRHHRRLLVEIECDQRKFKSYSVNVSAGGVLLEKALPDWVVGYCLVRLMKPEGGDSRELTCSIVENQDPQKRHRIEFSAPTSEAELQSLETWLAA